MKILISISLCLLALVGCGEAKLDPKVEASRVQSAKGVRDYYDKSNGNWEALSPEDKSAVLKEFGGKEGDAKKAWDMIKAHGTPVSGGSSTGVMDSSQGSASHRPAGQ